MAKQKSRRPTTVAYRQELSKFRDPGLFKPQDEVSITRERGGWYKFLFGLKGRAALAEYWFVMLSLGFIGFGGHWLDARFAGGQAFFPDLGQGRIDLQGAAAANIGRLVGYGLVAWAALANTLKRFKDRDLPFWLLLLALTPLAGPPLVQALSPLPSKLVVDVLLGVTWLGPVWLVFELFLQQGTLGDNTYGPDPRET